MTIDGTIENEGYDTQMPDTQVSQITQDEMVMYERFQDDLTTIIKEKDKVTSREAIQQTIKKITDPIKYIKDNKDILMKHRNKELQELQKENEKTIDNAIKTMEGRFGEDLKENYTRTEKVIDTALMYMDNAFETDYSQKYAEKN